MQYDNESHAIKIFTYIAVDELEKSGLSSSVGTDQSQPGVEVEAEFEVLVDPGGLVVVSETDVLKKEFDISSN